MFLPSDRSPVHEVSGIQRYKFQVSNAALECLNDGPLPLDFRSLAACIRDTLEDSNLPLPLATLLFPEPFSANWRSGLSSPQGGVFVIFGNYNRFEVAIPNSAGGSTHFFFRCYVLRPVRL